MVDITLSPQDLLTLYTEYDEKTGKISNTRSVILHMNNDRDIILIDNLTFQLFISIPNEVDPLLLKKEMIRTYSYLYYRKEVMNDDLSNSCLSDNTKEMIKHTYQRNQSLFIFNKIDLDRYQYQPLFEGLCEEDIILNVEYTETSSSSSYDTGDDEGSVDKDDNKHYNKKYKKKMINIEDDFMPLEVLDKPYNQKQQQRQNKSNPYKLDLKPIYELCKVFPNPLPPDTDPLNKPKPIPQSQYVIKFTNHCMLNYFVQRFMTREMKIGKHGKPFIVRVIQYEYDKNNIKPIKPLIKSFSLKQNTMLDYLLNQLYQFNNDQETVTFHFNTFHNIRVGLLHPSGLDKSISQQINNKPEHIILHRVILAKNVFSFQPFFININDFDNVIVCNYKERKHVISSYKKLVIPKKQCEDHEEPTSKIQSNNTKSIMKEEKNIHICDGFIRREKRTRSMDDFISRSEDDIKKMKIEIEKEKTSTNSIKNINTDLNKQKSVPPSNDQYIKKNMDKKSQQILNYFVKKI